MTPQEVNQVFDKGSSTTEKPSLPPPPFLENQPRAPKVLQWFDNPYFIQQEPKKPLTNNLQNEIEISKTKLHDISPEKVKPEKISISQNPSAFEKSVHNLATLAYATGNAKRHLAQCVKGPIFVQKLQILEKLETWSILFLCQSWR